jgi:hypothetical protein
LKLQAGGIDSAAPGAESRPCLIVNPRSFRASRLGLAGRAARLARDAGVEVVEVRAFADFRRTLELLRARRQDQVWVLSGDGTLHALAEFMSELPPGDWAPRWIFLGGGRANIVPRDCGGHPPMRRLRSAIAAWRAGRALPEERLVGLGLTQPGTPTRHGFVLAGALIHQGVRWCSEHRSRGEGWLHRSWFADPFALLHLLWLAATGRNPLPPWETLEVRCADGRLLHAPVRVLMATTLALRDAPYNPYAARGAGAVRVTAIAATAAHFWRHFPAVFRGRFGDDMDLAQGFLSGRSDWVEVRGLSGYSLDGEAVTTDPSLPVRLAPGLEWRVLRP